MAQYDTPEWFPFYVYAFLGDELVQAMTLDQVGAYTLLMVSQWINGSIPADIPSLARMMRGRTSEEMEEIWEGLRPCFTDAGNGRLVQKRLAAEREKALSKMAGNVKGGRASALARELKRNSNPSQPEAPLDRPLCNVMSPQTTEERTKRREENVSQWEQFKALYPVHRLDEEPAARAWVSREEEAEAILTGLRLVVTSEEWTRDGGKYVPKASRFIGEGMYADAARLGKPKESKRRPYFDPRTITG